MSHSFGRKSLAGVISTRIICDRIKLATMPLVVPALGLATSSQRETSESPKKPNLRQAARNDKPAKVIVAVCILAAIYMYPMIFRPLFGFNSLGEQQLEEAKAELSKHRPDFMPEWSSPFGPRGSKDE